MGNDFSNFWQQEWNGVKDSWGMIQGGLSGVMSGDFSKATNAADNWKQDWRNIGTGKNTRIAQPVNFEKQQLESYNTAINPSAAWNQNTWQSQSVQANPLYSSAAGNSNVKPSDLMKISDPSTKVAIASTRGSMRGAVTAYGSKLDTSAAPALVGGATPVATSGSFATASAVPDSAGDGATPAS